MKKQAEINQHIQNVESMLKCHLWFKSQKNKSSLVKGES